mmetsp:Transcript_14496/g.21752  ORF Transcript_14496/g.21752 Transcript_14496/m.21752 type:complete len:83 (+) Transcript_14496:10-258(+)
MILCIIPSKGHDCYVLLLSWVISQYFLSQFAEEQFQFGFNQDKLKVELEHQLSLHHRRALTKFMLSLFVILSRRTFSSCSSP